MTTRRQRSRIHPFWWAVILFAVIAAIVVVCSMLFSGTLRSYVPVTLTSDRSGLVMESGAQVKMRGVEVGRVAAIDGGTQPVSLRLHIFPDQARFIPANVEAQIRATTAFGAKYVDLVYPEHPSPQRLSSGAVLRSRNVATEVNTVFQNLSAILDQVDVTKLNATLTAIADGVRGQGERIGQATTDANQVLLAVNPRMTTVARDWRSFKDFSDAYASAAQDILTTLDNASTTSATLVDHASDLDALLLNVTGFSRSGIKLIAPNQENLVAGINGLEPTTDLLMKYNPVYTCMLVGAKNYLDNGGRSALGGNGRTLLVDAGLLLGDDPYRYPDHLPVVAAKGGPGGRPGCGSLPDVAKNFPVRYLVTNSGWGTGIDLRPNPGIGHPCWVNFFPVTRAVPEPPSIRQCIPGPAIGPVPYPGAPPYGADLYADDGTPLWPGVPPAPPPRPATDVSSEAVPPSSP
ncbi:MCE family protein [Mycolicibacterium pulveris]|uniref:Virulence factor n=1 Tax=Mycolicibacterium pulveris TaxID=36813 RepID=A0A7I7UQH9_MYCPV|nr:MCE family protein [Mycolicibacterium pulveris]MCV6983832.1 MCE family protein [Mycolicibacterium pulveris]BBY83715.1 virulence factor [Mycolicibacterium pulveris]